MRLTTAFLSLFLAIAASPSLFAQGPGVIAVHSSYERSYAVVPMQGKGTMQDPIRPMFVPAEGFKQGFSGIIAYSYQLSDDGKSALVEFVSTNRAGLRPILESKLPGVKAFERGRHSTAEIEAVFRAKKKDFDFSKFQNKVR